MSKHRLIPMTNRESETITKIANEISKVIRRSGAEVGISLAAIRGFVFVMVEQLTAIDSTYTLETFIEDLRQLSTAPSDEPATRRTWKELDG